MDDGDNMAPEPTATTGGGEGQGAGAAEEAVAPAGAGDEDERDRGGGGGGKLLQVRKRSSRSPTFMLNRLLILPRQARDKHFIGKALKNRPSCCPAAVRSRLPLGLRAAVAAGACLVPGVSRSRPAGTGRIYWCRCCDCWGGQPGRVREKLPPHLRFNSLILSDENREWLPRQAQDRHHSSAK